MARYALGRLLGMVPTLSVIMALSFALVRLTPGSPFTQERALAPEVRAALDARYGLDKPLLRQFGAYLWGLAHGDLGPSIRYPDRSVAELIALGLPHSFMLAAVALTFGIGAGVAVALIGAWALLVGRRRLALAVVAVTTAAQSLPSFVLGPLLVLAFSVGLRLLPPAGWSHWSHAILPGLTLGTVLMSHVSRLVYGALGDLRSQEFVRVARAKGLTPWSLLWRHMLIPALVPLITYLGPAVAGVLVGSVATERIFCVPGLGPYFVDAALNRDYFLVMGIVLLESVLLLVCNLISDLICAWLDPRVRMAHRP